MVRRWRRCIWPSEVSRPSPSNRLARCSAMPFMNFFDEVTSTSSIVSGWLTRYTGCEPNVNRTTSPYVRAMVVKNVSGSRRNFRKWPPGIHEVGPGAMRSAAKVVVNASPSRGEEHEDHSREVEEIRRRDEQAGERGDAVRPDHQRDQAHRHRQAFGGKTEPDQRAQRVVLLRRRIETALGQSDQQQEPSQHRQAQRRSTEIRPHGRHYDADRNTIGPP